MISDAPPVAAAPALPTATLLSGWVWHRRLLGARHEFRHPLLLLALDVTAQAQAPRPGRLGRLPNWLLRLKSSSGGWGLFSIRLDDYLRRPGDPAAANAENSSAALLDRMRAYLLEAGLAREVSRCVLLTAPRYLGYSFNPVSFFYLYTAPNAAPAGPPNLVVAEVNNTFRETHLYILHSPAEAAPGAFQCQKVFHVSPFNDMSGEYQFEFRGDFSRSYFARIDLIKNGQLAFESSLAARARPSTPAAWLLAALAYPCTTLATTPRILWEAAILYYRKHMTVYTKPEPSSALTISRPGTRVRDRLAQRLVMAQLAKLAVGSLRLELPGGMAHSFGGAPSPAATLRVHDARFFSAVVRRADIGFGESFTQGWWSSPDLTALIELLILNREQVDDSKLRSAWFARIVSRLQHGRRKNTLTGSRKNISAHYDLGNAMYALFLDESMTYSAALWNAPEENLAQAQQNKLRAMIEHARIGPDDHVLEVGCGWGSFALKAARETGCRVTGLTLSAEQLKFARERAAAAGLADRVQFELCDYRSMQGQFSRIVSIEMLEAVGHAHLRDYFSALERLLLPGGLVALQVITIPDQRYEAYRRGCDWIQKYIFPGGMLPSLGALQGAISDSSQFVVEKLENIGPHYARTLRHWRERFEHNSAELAEVGVNETFHKAWTYYLSYCEAAFRTRTLSTLQLVLTRPVNPTLIKADLILQPQEL